MRFALGDLKSAVEKEQRADRLRQGTGICRWPGGAVFVQAILAPCEAYMSWTDLVTELRHFGGSACSTANC